MDLMASAGIAHPDQVDRNAVSMRVDRTTIQTFAETYPELEKGCLLDENKVPKKFKVFWKKATVESF